MKYEQENREKSSPLGSAMGIVKRGPDVSAAAKSGQPAMTSLRPMIPESVPKPPPAAAGRQAASRVMYRRPRWSKPAQRRRTAAAPADAQCDGSGSSRSRGDSDGEAGRRRSASSAGRRARRRPCRRTTPAPPQEETARRRPRSRRHHQHQQHSGSHPQARLHRQRPPRPTGDTSTATANEPNPPG